MYRNLSPRHPRMGAIQAAIRPTIQHLESRVFLSTYYVDDSGADAAAGTAAAPWKTLQKAANSVVAGDTVIVKPGTYVGFSLTRSGTASARITFSAEPGALINTAAPAADSAGVPAGINLGLGTDVPNYTTIEGFTLQPLASQGEWYAGIRAAGKSSPRLNGVIIRNNTVRIRTIAQATPDKYGIYVAWSIGTVIENNTISGGYNSGVYVANSSRDYFVRGNEVFDVGGNGIHNNGDLAAGSPGINTNGTIENNVIHNVGYGIGGQAISADALQDSIIRNNLIYDAHAKGISLYVTNGADGSKRNTVVNNTVITSSTSTSPALRIPGGGNTDNTIFNNIFLSKRTSFSGDGGYSYSDESGGNFYNNNLVSDPVQRQISFASWKSQGRDVNGLSASAADLPSIFVDPANGDFRLKSGSRAINAGTASYNGKSAPTTDFEGNTRPAGTAHDMGYDEVGTSAPDTTAPVISGVNRSNLTHSGATVTWTTNEASDSQVEYGATTSYGSTTTLAPAMVTNHSVNLADLQPNTVYHYRVKSRDAAGNLAVSGDFTFTTPAAPDTTAPALTNVTTASTSSNGATVTWTSNEPSDTQVEYGPTTSYGSSTVLAPAMVTNHGVDLTGLQPNTLYHYRVKSRDAAGNLAVSADFTFTTAPAADATAPTAASSGADVTAGGASSYTFTVNYADNAGVNVATIDSADVRVTGPNGFSQTATLVTVDQNTNGTPRIATYSITPPGGTWDLADNGTYSILMRASQVADTSGNFVAAATLGTFGVSVPDPSVITGTSANDNMFVRLNTAGTSVQVYQGTSASGTLLYTLPMSSLTRLTFDLGAGNDLLILATSNGSPIPSGGLVYAGGGQTDRLEVRGSSALSAATYAPHGTQSGSGTFGVGGRSVSFSGLSGVVTKTFSSVSITTPNANDDVTFDSPAVGSVRLAGTSGAATLAPITLNGTTSVMLDAASADGTAGNTDRVTVSVASGAGETPNLQILAGTGSNSLVASGGMTNLEQVSGQPMDVSVASGAAVTLWSSTALGTLNVNGGRVDVAPSGNNLLRLTGLSIVNGGTLDLGDNAMLIQGTAANVDAAFSVANGYVGGARNGGTWDAPGITSSAIAASSYAQFLGLATIRNTDNGNQPIFPTFRGQPVDVNSILIGVTWNGDVDLDGVIDADDYHRIDRGFYRRRTGYRNGDVDYSGRVDLQDYALVDAAFIAQEGMTVAEALAAASAPAGGSSSPLTSTSSNSTSDSEPAFDTSSPTGSGGDTTGGVMADTAGVLVAATSDAGTETVDLLGTGDPALFGSPVTVL